MQLCRWSSTPNYILQEPYAVFVLFTLFMVLDMLEICARYMLIFLIMFLTLLLKVLNFLYVCPVYMILAFALHAQIRLTLRKYNAKGLHTKRQKLEPIWQCPKSTPRLWRTRNPCGMFDLAYNITCELKYSPPNPNFPRGLVTPLPCICQWCDRSPMHAETRLATRVKGMPASLEGRCLRDQSFM